MVLSVNFVSHNDISHGMEAETSLELLNFFITKVADSVEKTGGFLDKIMGSQLIGVWGISPSSGEISDEVMNCLQSAINIRTTLWDLNIEREAEGKLPIRMYCGIHTGEVLAGSIGTSVFHNYTVTGKVLDDAAKFGDLNRLTETDIIISEEIRNLAETLILAEELAIPESENCNARLFGLVNLTPSQEHEIQRWPFTLIDVQESLTAGRNIKDSDENNSGNADENGKAD